jgi:hypothetical protein
MRDRRNFFLVAVASVLAIGAGPPSQAPVQRFNREKDRFEPIHRRLIRSGDHIWVEGDGVYLACTDAEPHLDGRWTFGVCMVIDPKTNTWQLL